jgi:diamine N-acetyltransferase
MSNDLSPKTVTLVPVTAENRAAVIALELTREQAYFLASNADSMEDADEDACARPRAIMANGQLVGFLMYNAPDDEDEDEALIYRFMICAQEQGRGYGKAALQAVLSEIRALKHIKSVLICYEPENDAAHHLYHAAGFVEEGLDEDGEMIASLTLAADQDPS